ncbi:MAG: VWA domain-containing protein [Bryobacteraceae bacterium]
MHYRFGLAFLTAGLAVAAAQSGGATVAPVGGYTAAPAQKAPETKAVEEPATFHARVNLVMVPVVVRDKYDKVIGTLKQEDFRLADRGKPQEIIKFSVETPARPSVYRTSSEEKSGGAAGAPAELGEASPAPLPDRFVGYLFDDVHTSFADIARVRDAAIRHLDNMGPKERAAVYTISGTITQEFTDDRELLGAAIKRIIPHPIARPSMPECPDISYYQADLIVNKNDSMALQAAVADTMACQSMDPTMASAAQSQAQGAAQRRLTEGEQETRVALYTLTALVRRMGTMPGQRLILLASAGFITPFDELQQMTDVLDAAIKANVVIGTLDARGLYTDMPDASRPSSSYTGQSLQLKLQYDREAARAQADILAELAAGTGGTFFQNNNDLYAGFERVAAAPDYVYMLGFSPQNLRLDGSFHSLKVTLKSGVTLSIQARKGYYAPRHLTDPKETAREEISEALFSREEMTDLPVALMTQYFKSSESNARVTVLMRVDAKKLKFRKEDDRNCNELTIVTALFDRNGNYVMGNQKRLDMKLRDETLAKRLDNGLTVRSSFDVKPGAYMVRLVVRDAEGQLMSASNGSLDIR